MQWLNNGEIMSLRFETALQFTLKWEGGLSNDKDDPGGKTNYGITQETFNRYFPGRDVSTISLPEAATIYRNGYWVASGCESLPIALAVVVFDSAVNCGVSRAKKWLEQTQDPKEIIRLRREYYYRIASTNPKLKKFIKGWVNRLNDLGKLTDILLQDAL